jgi:tetratricopeptide (TPR) repeat protein
LLSAKGPVTVSAQITVSACKKHMASTLTQSEEAQLAQTIEMFEVITESQPHDYQSLEILKEAYSKLGREKDVVRTSKRIAEAYVDMGQLSSAILEYETILQRCPDDPDVQKALKQIESKASNFSEGPSGETEMVKAPAPAKASKSSSKSSSAAEQLEDGRQLMQKYFVESKIISPGDFDLCWIPPDAATHGVIEPFIQILADKGILPIEKSLKVLSDKGRVAFLPLEKYDIDIDLTRNFPAQLCQRWCVLPFDRMSKSVLVATANPFNQQAAKELAAATPHRLLWYLTQPAELIKNLRKAFR